MFQHPVLLFILLFVISQTIYADTILVPDDYPSVQEAVEAAESGDEIRITSDEVYWLKYVDKGYAIIGTDPLGIVIENKDITITGPELKAKIIEHEFETHHEDAALVRVINSDVIIKNILVEEPLMGREGHFWYTFAKPSPIIVESGTLSVFNSELKCTFINLSNLYIDNCKINGSAVFYLDPYNITILHEPTIQSGPGDDSNITIKDSLIYGGYNNVSFGELINSNVKIIRSELIGLSFTYQQGMPAMVVEKCKNVKFILENAIFTAGDGHDSSLTREWYASGSTKGGSGILISNSEIELKSSGVQSEIKGGKGGDAFISSDIVYPNAKTELYLTPGSDGGNGIELVNSKLMIQEQSLQEMFSIHGGAGGQSDEFQEWFASPGQPGQAISIDESSEIITMAAVNNWMVYQ